MLFKDRTDAGKQLAVLLKKYRKRAVVYGLPRGGVIIAGEIAKKLHIPLDVLLVRKIGHPSIPEYAIGAVSEHGYKIFNLHDLSGIDRQWLNTTIKYEAREIAQRRKKYKDYIRPHSIKNKVAIVVDDGVATGATMKAAILEIDSHHPKQIIIAVPVCTKEFQEEIENAGQKLVALHVPEAFSGSVGAYYKRFPQVPDEQVIHTLTGENE